MKLTTNPPQFLRYSAGKWDIIRKNVIIETPVSLTVNGQVLITLMCTPTDLESLAVGFLFNEGLIASKDEIASVRVCGQGENVDLWLEHSLEKPDRWWRTSGCTGGVTSIGNEPDQDRPTSLEQSYLGSLSNIDRSAAEKPQVTLAPQQITELMEQILEAQSLYRLAGGVHSSALSDGRQLLVVTEDIGRHNTLDKIAGRCLLENIVIQPRQRGRITTERSGRQGRS